MDVLNTFALTACGASMHLTQTTCTLDDGEQMRYTTYGVALTDLGGNELAAKQDISTDRDFVERFARKCVRCELRVENFEDCLEDYLSEYI